MRYFRFRLSLTNAKREDRLDRPDRNPFLHPKYLILQLRCQKFQEMGAPCIEVRGRSLNASSFCFLGPELKRTCTTGLIPAAMALWSSVNIRLQDGSHEHFRA